MQISQLCLLVSAALWLVVPLPRLLGICGFISSYILPHHPSVPVTSINRDIVSQKTVVFSMNNGGFFYYFFYLKQ